MTPGDGEGGGCKMQGTREGHDSLRGRIADDGHSSPKADASHQRGVDVNPRGACDER